MYIPSFDRPAHSGYWLTVPRCYGWVLRFSPWRSCVPHNPRSCVPYQPCSFQLNTALTSSWHFIDPHHVFFSLDLLDWLKMFEEHGQRRAPYLMGHVYILSGIFPIGWVSKVPPWGQHVVPTAWENAEIGCRGVDATEKMWLLMILRHLFLNILAVFLNDHFRYLNWRYCII